MSTVSRSESGPKLPVPLLASGDRMKQPEFHRRYLACPEDQKFELVGGVVYMASPLRWPHGAYHLQLGTVLQHYAGATPGVAAGDNATAILGEESEPQPDLVLRIEAECGGQSRINNDEYLEGPPELLAEIAHSSRALDMHGKRDDYRSAGVVEYLVLCIEERELHWFHFPSRGVIRPRPDGIARSKIFPGLWLDVAGLLAQDYARIFAGIQQGLAYRSHAAFVKRLESIRRKRAATVPES